MVGSGRDTHATFFSFYATKCITTGEGGMITTNNDELAENIKRLRLHGFNRTMFDRYTNIRTGWKYDIAAPGWKANMTDIAAAMGLAQLARADDMLIRRQQIAQFYRDGLKDAGVVLPKLIMATLGTPIRSRSITVTASWRIWPRSASSARCISFRCRCTATGSRRSASSPACPNAEAIYARPVSLPIFSKMTDKDVQRVVDAVLLFQERDFAERS